MILRKMLFYIFLALFQETVYSASELYYVAGVVEYFPEITSPDSELLNLENYISIIHSEDAKEVDILVFPERSLSRLVHEVPEPDAKIVPCSDDNYTLAIQNISCAAQKSKKYVLINIYESVQCSQGMIDMNLCSSKGYKQYNTNVVFDRTGAIISRYRKFNLFNEEETDSPSQPEVAIFETDFNVKFGHLISIDIMFEEPAVSLLNRNVTEILYPSLWYSELPFLTSVQVQQFWSYKANVNLLAAGTNLPRIGSTGSGIYNGRNGALINAMFYNEKRKLFVSQVPKINSYEGSIALGVTLPTQTYGAKDNLQLRQDSLELFNSKLLNFNENIITEEICYNDICCTANITWEIQAGFRILFNSSEIFYQYRFGIFNGVRRFSDNSTVGVIACGIYACTNETVESCGIRFSSKSDYIKDFVTFKSMSIKASFEINDRIVLFPTALDESLVGLSTDSFRYSESNTYKDLDGKTFRMAKLDLTEEKCNLLSFGIWGRNYNKDGSEVSAIYKQSGGIGAIMSIYWILTFNCAAIAIYFKFIINI